MKKKTRAQVKGRFITGHLTQSHLTLEGRPVKYRIQENPTLRHVRDLTRNNCQITNLVNSPQAENQWKLWKRDFYEVQTIQGTMERTTQGSLNDWIIDLINWNQRATVPQCIRSCLRFLPLFFLPQWNGISSSLSTIYTVRSTRGLTVLHATVIGQFGAFQTFCSFSTALY